MTLHIPNLRRRRLIEFAMGGVAISVISSGCATKPPPNRTYTEDLSAIMLSADKKNIVFFGRDHHYVFDTPARLMAILDSPLRPKLEATFFWFRVAPDRTVNGHIRLSVSTPEGAFHESNKRILEILAPFGKHTISKTATSVSSEGIEIRGRRYHSQPDTQPTESQKLNRTYQVTLEEWPTTQVLNEYNNSPVKKMSDGAMSVLMIPLIPVAFLILLSGGGPCFNCK